MLMRHIKVKQEDCAPFSDMLKVVGHRAGIKPKTVERIYNEMLKYIVEELQFREAVYLKGMGYFGTVQMGGNMMKMPEKPGSSVVVEKYIEPKAKIRFKSTKSFEDKVNAPIGEAAPEKRGPHKRGQLIEDDDLKKERRALVKSMLQDEGHKMYDKKYADQQLETLDFTDMSELEVFADNYED